MTSWLDYYVRGVVTRGTPSAASDHVAIQEADQLDVLEPLVTYDWLGYNMLPEDVREPLQPKSNKVEKTAPTLANDPEDAAVLKDNEIARNRLAMTSVLDCYVQDLAINESPNVAPDRVADNWTGKLDVPKPEITYGWLGYNRPPEDARDPLRAGSMKSDKAAPRYVKHLHQAQRWSTLLNSGVELCSP